MEKIYTTKNVKETKQLAANLALRLQQGMIITLDGQLASGKTTFTKGFGVGLNIQDPINSPTFTISKIYEGSFPLLHIDAYRLEGIDQELGFEDYFDDQWMVLIEWPMFIAHLLPKDRIDVRFEVVDETTRVITLSSSDKHASLLEDLL